MTGIWQSSRIKEKWWSQGCWVCSWRISRTCCPFTALLLWWPRYFSSASSARMLNSLSSTIRILEHSHLLLLSWRLSWSQPHLRSYWDLITFSRSLMFLSSIVRRKFSFVGLNFGSTIFLLVSSRSLSLWNNLFSRTKENWDPLPHSEVRLMPLLP